jgi:uncharacterized protein YdaU (DUF1376 family)
VNYYPHHLGDYDSATAHLSWDEDMAYWRLLRVYYRLEKPIPADTGDACRLARAKTTAQKKAVEDVLREFFDLADDGWHNKRADEEILKAKEEGEENKAKKENEAERQRRHRARRSRLFDELRKLDVVPKWDTATEELERLLQRARHGDEPVTAPQPVTGTDTAIHKPITKPKEQQGAFAPPDWVPTDAWTAWLEVRRKKRVPNTDEALRLSVLDLERFRDAGHDPRAVLEQSTKRGWQGLFELKAEAQAQATPMQAMLGNCQCGAPATMKVGGKPRCQAHIRGIEAVA